MISYIMGQWMGSYAALVVVFWGIVYMIGCVVAVVIAPKVCKGIFTGSSVIGTMLGGMLTSFAAGAMGTLAFAGATGMLGTGTLAKAAGALTGGGVPGASGAGAGPSPGPALAANAAAPALSGAANLAADQSDSGSNANFSPFSAPSGRTKGRGAVSEALAGSRGGGGNAPKSRFQPGTILGADGQPIYTPPANDGVGVGGPSLAPLPAGSFQPSSLAASVPSDSAGVSSTQKKPASASRVMSLVKGTAQIAKHTALAAGSGGSLGGYIQAHMALNKSRPVPIGDNRADEGVPDVIGRN